MTTEKTCIMMLALAAIWLAQASAESVYETPATFVTRAFMGSPPAPQLAWLSGARKSAVRQLLGHDYAALRIRYWCQAGRSAWVLEEVGKDLPITVGVVIDKSFISSLQVLIYRENRGGEVSAPAFTGQFNGVALTGDDTLDTTIDGISGATLSVRALTKLATMALFLHADTGCKDGTK